MSNYYLCYDKSFPTRWHMRFAETPISCESAQSESSQGSLWVTKDPKRIQVAAKTLFNLHRIAG